jgi:hypothetical protein
MADCAVRKSMKAGAGLRRAGIPVNIARCCDNNKPTTAQQL